LIVNREVRARDLSASYATTRNRYLSSYRYL